MPEIYELAPESIGDDTYIIISRGHHDVHEFMRKVRQEGWDWPLGVPEHIWMKTMPARNEGERCWYQPVEAGTRGAWPCTYVREAYGEDRYEHKFPRPTLYAASQDPARRVRIDYTNWRGERGHRVIEPGRIFWGNTDYHPESQWLMDAWDWDKQAERTFALRDIHSWAPVPTDAPATDS